MRTDPRFQKWCNWLKDITDDVQNLYLSRDIFTGVIDIVKKNERIDKESMFFGFFINTYADSVVMGLRRQLKIDKDSISLAGLLSEILGAPELITRSDYYELFKDSNMSLKMTMMEEGFNQFAEPNSLYIDSERVKFDLQSLKDICREAEEYADRRVAHRDKRSLSFDPSLDNILKGLDLLGDLVRRYNLLFFASDLKIHPVPQYPIFHIFEERWLVSSSLPKNDIIVSDRPAQ